MQKNNRQNTRRKEDKDKVQVLLDALEQAPFEKNGFAPSALFPRGTLDLALFFSAWADEEMATIFADKAFLNARIRDKIAQGVKARLEVLAPYKSQVAACLRFLSSPRHAGQGPRLVWQTADVLWRGAGDTATDFNHYTKRLLLSAVLVSTTLYWLNDHSLSHEKTWTFLDRRIANVLKLGGMIAKFKKKA